MIETLKAAIKAYDHINETNIKPSVCAGVQRAFADLRHLISELEKAEPVGSVGDLVDEFVMPTLEHIGITSKTMLYSHPAPAPQGWKLVPVEPTDGMIEAMWNYETFADPYESVLAAAPEYGK